MSPFFLSMLVGVTALAVTLGISSFTVNRLVRRKLRLSLFLFGAYVLLHVVIAAQPRVSAEALERLSELAQLGFAAALINLLVVTLLNPLRVDRIPDRFPSIVQDAFVIGTFMLVATFAFSDKVIATSAVGAVVLGFALQDTLGNAFAGLAIQSEKPFNIGHWITVGGHEGRVAEVTWRATRLRTKTGNFVIVPNSEVGKAPITNYSEPAAPMRLFVDVGVSYDAPPNQVKAVIKAALANCPLVLNAPAADAMIHDFASSAITYRVRFWIEDFELDEEAADQVRSSLFYAFKRHDIEIPYPIQIEMSKDLPTVDQEGRISEREQLIATVPLFASLSAEERATIAARMNVATYGDGEVIVREGEPGQSMFLVKSGRVTVRFEENRRAIVTLARGDYFGEMSMLTGAPRTASVVADGDAVVLEVDADVFRQLATANPLAVEQVGLAAASRREEFEDVPASTRAAAVVEAPGNIVSRMRKFLRI